MMSLNLVRTPGEGIVSKASGYSQMAEESFRAWLLFNGLT